MANKQRLFNKRMIRASQRKEEYRAQKVVRAGVAGERSLSAAGR
jgi:hypothetical protein